MFGFQKFGEVFGKKESGGDKWVEQKIETFIAGKLPVRIPMYLLDQMGKRVTDKDTGEMLYDDSNVQDGWVILKLEKGGQELIVEKPDSLKLTRRTISLNNFLKYNGKDFTKTEE
jgi:hypothetical protein